MSDFKIAESEVIRHIQLWADAIIGKEIDSLMNLYSEKAVLCPTLSPIIRDNHEKIKPYFVGGGEFNDSPGFMNMNFVEVEFPVQYVIVEQDIGVGNGIYIFQTESGEKISARYTFVFKKVDENSCQIITHHSSASPI